MGDRDKFMDEREDIGDAVRFSNFGTKRAAPRKVEGLVNYKLS
jgi:hypothetical protein